MLTQKHGDFSDIFSSKSKNNKMKKNQSFRIFKYEHNSRVN